MITINQYPSEKTPEARTSKYVFKKFEDEHHPLSLRLDLLLQIAASSTEKLASKKPKP